MKKFDFTSPKLALYEEHRIGFVVHVYEDIFMNFKFWLDKKLTHLVKDGRESNFRQLLAYRKFLDDYTCGAIPVKPSILFLTRALGWV